MASKHVGTSVEEDKTSVTEAAKSSNVLIEGTAKMQFEEGEQVFYNPVQVLNRDVSIQCITLFSKIIQEEKITAQRGKLVKRVNKLKALQGGDAGQTKVEASPLPALTAAKAAETATSDTATPVAASCAEGAPKKKRKKKKKKKKKGTKNEGPAPPTMEDQLRNDPKALEDAINKAEKLLADFDTGGDDSAGITILEALSATGLRSIRYAQEIPNVRKIVANDLLPAAAETIRRNVLFNGIDPNFVVASQGDAIKVMHDSKERPDKFDVIDLDPYGAPTVFLDSAVQAVKDGGLLLVTCTDMPDLAGNTPETCWAKYGSVSMKSKACKEVALRTVLACLASHAARYGRYIEPMLSLSLDFYIRVFVRVHKGRLNLKLTPTKLSMYFQSTGCRSWLLQPLARTAKTNQHKILPGMMRYDNDTFAEFYGFPFEIGGPIWNAPIHDPAFVKRLLEQVTTAGKTKIPTWTRLHGVLTAVSEELTDAPLYYDLCSLANTLHCEAVKKKDFFAALRNAGYRVSGSHAAPTVVKTDAPQHVIWDIMRSHCERKPVHAKWMQEGRVPYRILSRKRVLEVDWTRDKATEVPLTPACRFPPNPTKYWGPGVRVGRTNKASSTLEAALKSQNAKRTRMESVDHPGGESEANAGKDPKKSKMDNGATHSKP